MRHVLKYYKQINTYTGTFSENFNDFLWLKALWSFEIRFISIIKNLKNGEKKNVSLLIIWISIALIYRHFNYHVPLLSTLSFKIMVFSLWLEFLPVAKMGRKMKRRWFHRFWCLYVFSWSEPNKSRTAVKILSLKSWELILDAHKNTYNIIKRWNQYRFIYTSIRTWSSNLNI